MLKLYSFILYFLLAICSFFIGMSVAGLTNAGEGQMLAGGAIVFGYGVVGAFIGFMVSLFIANKADRTFIIKANIILVFAILGFFAFFYYKYNVRQKAREKKELEEVRPKTQTTSFSNISAGTDNALINNILVGDIGIGLGMFAPNYTSQSKLYFYNISLNTESILVPAPYDSITFNQAGQDIATAPPWLVPEHMKIDYGILYFKVKSATKNYIEIVANKITGQTAFVRRASGTLSYWPDFLLNVHTVEFDLEEEQNIYVKPLDYAGKVQGQYSFMKPIRIADSWMYVELQDDGFTPVGNGWIKWIDTDGLRIRYSLLS